MLSIKSDAQNWVCSDGLVVDPSLKHLQVLPEEDLYTYKVPIHNNIIRRRRHRIQRIEMRSIRLCPPYISTNATGPLDRILYRSVSLPESKG